MKRCTRGGDSNVMGVVSTRPAILANWKKEYEDNDNYKVIGMLGQVPGKVSAENGDIRPGDSLTPASSTPGFVMRAGPGDPTVGVALEPLECDSGSSECKGIVNVLISRSSKAIVQV